MKFKYAYAAVPCNSEQGGMPLLRSSVVTTEENGIFIIAIEGAIQGKNITVPKKSPKSNHETDLEVLLQFVTERFEQLYSMTEEQARRELIQGITQNTKQRSARRGVGVPLLMAAMKNGRYLVCCCGDGIVGLREGDLQKGWSVINQPQAGFETAKPGAESLKVSMGLMDQDFTLVLMNSGACASLYNYGEEGISSACGTFGAWLKEYDGETVSEALTENIEKYFIKEAQGDICVAVVVPEAGEEAEEEAEEATEQIELAEEEAEEAAEPAAEQIELAEEEAEPAAEQIELAEEEAEEAAEPAADQIELAEEVETRVETEADANAVAKKLFERRPFSIKGGPKRVMLAAVVLMLTAAVIFAAWIGQAGFGNSDTVPPKGGGPEIAAEGGPEQDDSGNGKQTQNGEDTPDSSQELDPENINPAEHEPMISFAVSQPKAYEPGFYRVGQDLPAGEYFFWTGEMLGKDSIEINGETALSDDLYCMTVQVADGETLSSNYRFTSVENVNPIKITGGILISGKYRIGKDIAPGEYEIFPEKGKAPGRYYSVLGGKISSNTEVSGRITVTVPEEGYIVLYRSYLAVPEV
ncbi:hypothetical protein FRZ06_15845 [Anoxybacterium hadale]|uniref:Uncharacterized protein n=1 Tax=Anoxybacterium hadale TaxID=3408580 RepID=A0ACD1ADV2_9FIRM|nr:hypothetical protein FRZ06_15845 [Clostridiales bacterium]